MNPRLVAIATALLAISPAIAQQSTQDSPTLMEVEDGSKRVDVFNLTVDELEDREIRSRDGTRIGEIDEVLMTADGTIVAVSAEVGGFLGIGDREVVLRFDQLRRQGDGFVADLSREQIEALPPWKD